MAINNNYLAVFDFETGGLDYEKDEIIQVAAVIMDPRTFKVIDTFESMVKALRPNELGAKALEVNKKSVEEIMAAPHPKEIFSLFVQFLKKYKCGRSQWDNPIACGQNIISFDLPFLARYLKEYKLDSCFHPTIKLDTYHMHFMWFENAKEPLKYNMDVMRDFYGIDSKDAHDALKDCRDCAAIIARFLNLHRSLHSKVKFKGSLKNAG